MHGWIKVGVRTHGEPLDDFQYNTISDAVTRLPEHVQKDLADAGYQLHIHNSESLPSHLLSRREQLGVHGQTASDIVGKHVPEDKIVHVAAQVSAWDAQHVAMHELLHAWDMLNDSALKKRLSERKDWLSVSRKLSNESLYPHFDPQQYEIAHKEQWAELGAQIAGTYRHLSLGRRDLSPEAEAEVRKYFATQGFGQPDQQTIQFTNEEVRWPAR